ncbi:MAG: hypothetical protein DRZ76_01300, partial [Candidatus Nealsonbacteria bacterium]
MARKKKIKNKKRPVKEKKPIRFFLPEEIKRLIWGVAMFLVAVIVILSFFDLAGEGGRFFMKGFNFLVGKTVFLLPLFLILIGIAFFGLKDKNKWPVILAAFLLVLGASGIFEVLGEDAKQGGWMGYLAAWP